MTKIDIISGFLGAGKTTLIKKLLREGFQNEKLVLIENEFGEIGIDGGFLKEAGVQITEMNSGCICCSLVGDFSKALSEVLELYHPDRVIIEPSGVGKLSDVMNAVKDVLNDTIVLNSYTAVVDVKKCKMYMKNFGEFFNNQIENAKAIILSRTQEVSQDKLEASVALIREHNEKATLVTTNWDDIDGSLIVKAMEEENSFVNELLREVQKHDHHDHECGCDHDHDHDFECGCGQEHDHDHECGCRQEHDHDSECGCGHEHDHDSECGCGHEHDHDSECGCGHEHDHDHECGCGHDHEHDHDHECGCGHDHDHEHHHAEDVFTSWGTQTVRKYSKEELTNILEQLSEAENIGFILRAKGIVAGSNGEWFHFDMVPGEYEIREGEADITGRLCVIGSKLVTEEIERMFQ